MQCGHTDPTGAGGAGSARSRRRAAQEHRRKQSHADRRTAIAGEACGGGTTMKPIRNLPPYDNVLETVSCTPLIRLHRMTPGIRTPEYGKAEIFNTRRSVEDHIALP